MLIDSIPHINDNGLEQAKKAYMLRNNGQELERMKNQHEWIKGSFGGLIKAPIAYEKKHQKILDSAAADGKFHYSPRNASLTCSKGHGSVMLARSFPQRRSLWVSILRKFWRLYQK